MLLNRYKIWYSVLDMKPGQCIEYSKDEVREMSKIDMESLLIPPTNQDIENILKKLANIHSIQAVENLEKNTYKFYTRPLIDGI